MNQALAVSGEDKDFFAQGRVSWTSRCVRKLGEQPRMAIDYGCGIGSTVPVLLATWPLAHIVGVDVSSKSLVTARQKHGRGPVVYATIAEYQPQGDLDLAYTNGVFHHIAKPERLAAVAYVRNSLRPGGLFAFWENNPWSLATQYVMSKIAFDKGARTLSVFEAKRLLESAGFQIVRYDFMFIFPSLLKPLRSLEPLVSKMPFGAQYQILARKP